MRKEREGERERQREIEREREGERERERGQERKECKTLTHMSHKDQNQLGGRQGGMEGESSII